MAKSRTFSVRLPQTLLAKLEKKAIEDTRSVNNLITKILAEWVEAHESDKREPKK